MTWQYPRYMRMKMTLRSSMRTSRTDSQLVSFELTHTASMKADTTTTRSHSFSIARTVVRCGLVMVAWSRGSRARLQLVDAALAGVTNLGEVVFVEPGAVFPCVCSEHGVPLLRLENAPHSHG